MLLKILKFLRDSKLYFKHKTEKMRERNKEAVDLLKKLYGFLCINDLKINFKF